MTYAKIKVAGITVDLKDARDAEDAKERWDRAKTAVDSFFAALESKPEKVREVGAT